MAPGDDHRPPGHCALHGLTAPWLSWRLPRLEGYKAWRFSESIASRGGTPTPMWKPDAELKSLHVESSICLRGRTWNHGIVLEIESWWKRIETIALIDDKPPLGNSFCGDTPIQCEDLSAAPRRLRREAWRERGVCLLCEMQDPEPASAHGRPEEIRHGGIGDGQMLYRFQAREASQRRPLISFGRRRTRRLLKTNSAWLARQIEASVLLLRNGCNLARFVQGSYHPLSLSTSFPACRFLHWPVWPGHAVLVMDRPFLEAWMSWPESSRMMLRQLLVS